MNNKNIFKKMKEHVGISKLKNHTNKGWYLSNKIKNNHFHICMCCKTPTSAISDL